MAHQHLEKYKVATPKPEIRSRALSAHEYRTLGWSAPEKRKSTFWKGGSEISEKLYNAVAVALAYIYKIDKGEILDEPYIDIPEDLRFNENGQILNEKK